MTGPRRVRAFGGAGMTERRGGVVPPPSPDPGPPDSARPLAPSDLELLREYEPIARFTRGELFFPTAVGTYAAPAPMRENCSTFCIYRVTKKNMA